MPDHGRLSDVIAILDAAYWGEFLPTDLRWTGVTDSNPKVRVPATARSSLLGAAPEAWAALLTFC